MAVPTVLYGKQFEDNIQLAAQQLVSKFREKCVVKTGVKGSSKAFGYTDKENARDKSGRMQDTIYDDASANRITAYLEFKYKALMMDIEDELQIIADPKSAYVTSSLASLRRVMDSKLLDALRGTKYTGVNGTGTSALPAGQKIAAAASGLTLNKLLATLELFNDADVDEMDEKYIAIAPQQLTNLLNITEIKSSDYNTLKALVPGKVANFMGFNFTVSNLLTKVGTTRYAMAWSKSGAGLAIGKDIVGRVDEVQSKHYNWATYASMFIGATRIQDEKVVEISCTEV